LAPQPSYLIRPFREADAARVAAWRARPHVFRWWGDPDDEPEADRLVDASLAYWIVELNGRPFAFIQDYRIHAWPDHPFAFLPQGSRGMDTFIGEPALLGQGHGARFVRQHVDRMFRDGAPAAGIDPHPDNAPARRAFEKAGFATVGGPLETDWGRAILMERRAPA
jgi:aminoglycoside 6'-N-acetyltransferase